MDCNSIGASELRPSTLGKREYWESHYSNELDNYDDHSDEGDVWFGRRNMKRIVDWVKENVNVTQKILDLGCGNGLILIELAKRGFVKLTGVDYVRDAIRLAEKIANREKVADRVWFERADILAASDGDALCLSETFDVIIDKGTYDAICLSHSSVEQTSEISLVREKYYQRVCHLLNQSGLFIIMSCNWTKQELCSENHFLRDNRLELVHQIETPSIQFGGKSGNQVTCLIFKKLTQEEDDKMEC